MSLRKSEVGVEKGLRKSDDAIRSSQNGWLHNLGEYSDHITKVFRTTLETTPEWNIPLLYVEPYQYAEYNVGDFYTWHKDQEKPSEDGSIRSLSMSLILQSAEMGGEFEVAEHGPLEVRRGDMIVFPSFVIHRVTPVVQGKRISIVGWYRGRV